MKEAKNNISLSNLKVIDKLEIGPVKMESDRIVAPYRVYTGKHSDRIELIYRYEEKVLNPDDPGDQNLANMVAAQVAVNYGLFCDQIIYYGSFDLQDARFIREMTENTSREIYVKKFLEPNPFVLKETINLPAITYQRYTNAEISFVTEKSDAKNILWELWSTERSKHAILSSGGKDSLLSFGLLSEMGNEVHPIFINESGRHWYTALNAYRYFKKNIANTSKVWTNSDRIFNWMLRHLPFIRNDFSTVRSDEYPIRLWTVAIFLFGALPILKKRGIGRLLIGDEYDTTTRRTFKGITHYDGLFDQSRFFDNTLSRYFMAKGWTVTQFSILRFLSEMLILKILAERYPKIQKHQLSCHATHISNGRVFPCGKCEKCRRIVGMLMAINIDPAVCGYTKEQIKHCLSNLVKEGIHQESAGSEQLMYMLKEKGLISSDRKYNPRPEILSVRIDPQKSPIEGIPVDLRQALFHTMLKHASGARQKTGRNWTEIDLIKGLELKKPFPFETLVKPPVTITKGRVQTEKYKWGQLTWPEAEEYLKIVDVAILPVGSIEQHGPHLPLDTDSFDAEYLANQVASACSDPKPLVLPLIAYGISYHHDDFKGTISINNDTLSKLVYEIGMSLAKNGIKKILIINSHGGNSPTLNFAAQMINRDARIFVSVDSGETSDVDVYKMIETPNDVHAGEFETSTSLAIRPQLVKQSLAKKSVPKFSSRYLNFTSKRGISWYAYTKRISENGIMGDPTKADADKGRKLWQIMVAHLVAFVEDLKRMSLEEIHQRRY